MNASMDSNLSDWKVFTLPVVISHCLLVLLPSVFFNISILLVLILYKELYNPLSILYGFVPILAVYNSLITGPLSYVSLVRMMMSCDCSVDNVHRVSSVAVHRVLYPVLFAEISLLQLMILKRGKSFVSYKMTLILVAVTTFTYTPLPMTLFSIVHPTLCETACMGIDLANSSPSTSYRVYWIVLVVGWVTSMTVIVVVVGWIMYKKNVIHASRDEEHGISLKIATLPAVMPIIMHIQLLPFFLYFVRHSGIIGGINYQVLYIASPYFLSDLSGLVYPILLLYLSSNIRACWKKMFQVCLGTILQLGITNLSCCLRCCAEISLHHENKVVPHENLPNIESSQPTIGIQPTETSQPAKSIQPTETSQTAKSIQLIETSQPTKSIQLPGTSQPIEVTAEVEGAP